MLHNHDPWKVALEDSYGIEGEHLKCPKGRWTLNDAEVEVGPDGLKVVVLMPTAMHGAVKWEGGVIKARRLAFYDDAPPSDIVKPDDWDPYTQFLCVGADKAHRGQLMTFTSSSWGARKAFLSLIGPYIRTGKRAFPICTLGAKPRKNDTNGNIDPTLTAAGYAPCGDFADLVSLPQHVPALAPPTTHDDDGPDDTHNDHDGNDSDDDVPF